MAQIADWKVEWEVDAGENLDDEQVPAEQADHEAQCTRGMQRIDHDNAFGKAPEISGKTTKCRGQQGEDQDVDKVGPQGADEIDNAQKRHVGVEEAKRRKEDGRLEAGRRISVWVWRICAKCIEPWGEGGAQRQPEGAKGAVDDEWEGIAEHELEEGSYNGEKATEEVVGAADLELA